MGKVRVLRLIARMNVGGPAIQIAGLMRSLPVETFEQKLVTGFCDKNEVDYLEINELDITRKQLDGFGRSINIFSDLKVLVAIRREIKAFDPDIIHTHTSKAGFLGRIASLLTLKRQIRVHTFHGHLLYGYYGTFKTRLIVLAEKALALFTDKLVAVGSQVRDELLAAKIGIPEQYAVIAPGIELGRLPMRESALEYFHIPGDKYNISWIGRVVEVKAPNRIIEIATECKKRNLNVQFIVVGDGALLDKLKDLAEQTDLPIVFLGWQSNIEYVLGLSDLVMLTSENEGTPVSLIQAQMAGIPVLTTNVGSASEVMVDQQSGYCLDYSAENFVDRIVTLSNDAILQHYFGAAGKSHAVENFSLSRLADDYASLYLELTINS